MSFTVKHLAMSALWFGITAVCGGQAVAQTATPPAPLTTPAITGPLQALPPAEFNAGPFGKIAVNGVLDGGAMWTGNYISGDQSTQADLANGQVFIQKTDGWFQFYVQAGAYNLASLGTPFLSTANAMKNLYGPAPVAYVKLQAGKSTSILAGELPTLIGAEYTFTFENMNVNRGLLWNQETAISRGVQVNQTMGKLTASLSWNDGFYSNRYSWLSGSLAYTSGHHTLAFVAGGNAGQTAYQTAATPVQNNSTIYNALYTYNNGAWIVQPYWQYTKVATNAKIGIAEGNSTNGAALLVNRTFKGGFSLPTRFEYIASSGSDAAGSVNLMYGAGSKAYSATVTPTYQHGGFFVRGDLAWVHATDITPGSAFGRSGTSQSQPRAMAEFGFIFGNNIEK